MNQISIQEKGVEETLQKFIQLWTAWEIQSISSFQKEI